MQVWWPTHCHWKVQQSLCAFGEVKTLKIDMRHSNTSDNTVPRESHRTSEWYSSAVFFSLSSKEVREETCLQSTPTDCTDNFHNQVNDIWQFSSLCSMQCAQITCGATSFTSANSPLLKPAMALAPSVHSALHFANGMSFSLKKRQSLWRSHN